MGCSKDMPTQRRSGMAPSGSLSRLRVAANHLWPIRRIHFRVARHAQHRPGRDRQPRIRAQRRIQLLNTDGLSRTADRSLGNLLDRFAVGPNAIKLARRIAEPGIGQAGRRSDGHNRGREVGVAIGVKSRIWLA